MKLSWANNFPPSWRRRKIYDAVKRCVRLHPPMWLDVKCYWSHENCRASWRRFLRISLAVVSVRHCIDTIELTENKSSLLKFVWDCKYTWGKMNIYVTMSFYEWHLLDFKAKQKTNHNFIDINLYTSVLSTLNSRSWKKFLNFLRYIFINLKTQLKNHIV